MIENITINNYALIDKTDIELEPGFSVITGETGAGKSILLGAVGLTLGQRAESSAIMDKDKKCVVEITYNIAGYNLKGWFEENELDYSNSTGVRREVTADGKSRCFINDTPVSNKLLKEFGAFLVDVHSQHQSLLVGQPEYQLEILDAFCGNGGVREQYNVHYNVHRQLIDQLREFKEKAADAEREGDYLRFRFNQLENAHLQESEQQELEEELALLTNAESVKAALNGMTYHLRDMDGAVIQVLKNTKNTFIPLESALKESGEYSERLQSVIIELNDLADEAERRAERVEYNAGRIEAIHARLNVLYDLLYKYKAESVTELIRMRNELEIKLRGLENGTEEISRLEKELQKTEKRMDELSAGLHEVRTNTEQRLKEEMKDLLISLGIKHAEFVIDIQDAGEYTPTGRDRVRFLFAANKNQLPGEIARVASGGEISRVMLSLKYILSRTRQLPVIIFDEIDTGLSGEVAHRMAVMMQEMAKRMQVVSISHLPQIAAAGNCHFKVYKEDNVQSTISHIKKLSTEERIREIAAMISGKEITPAAIETAQDLLKN